VDHDELADDLADFLLVGAEVDDPALDDPPRPIANEFDAERMLRRIGRIDREVQRVRDFVAGEKAALDAYVADRTAGILREKQRIEESLAAWIAAQPVKTVTLPHGQVRRRGQRAKVWVLDDSPTAVEELAKLAPGVVRTTHELMRSAVDSELQVGPVIEDAVAPEPGYVVHAAVNADGEEVPHVRFLRPNDETPNFGYTVKP